MNWINKKNPHSQPQPAVEAKSVKSPEQSANDSLGDYLLPSARGIVVEEISAEEYAAILANQASPA